jgi:hypothetical protein
MKTLKFITAVMLAFMVTTSFAARIVKSKLGDIEVTNAKDGGKVFCTAEFNDELTIVKEAETKVLVKAQCGQGWVDKDKVVYVVKRPGDKSITLDEQVLVDWTDNPSAIIVFEHPDIDDEEVKMDRDFKEYLTYTIDREQTERRNGEN